MSLFPSNDDMLYDLGTRAVRRAAKSGRHRPVEWSAENLAILAVVFFVGGLVKGVIGTGLPTIAVALLAAFFEVKTAILLLMAPAIFTNVWQTFSGGALLRLTRRLAPLLIAIVIGIIAGYAVLANAGDSLLVGIMGAILCLYAVAGLLKVELPHPGRHEFLASAAVGLVNGIITGMTGTFVVPSVIYLQVLDFNRRELVQAMGITFLFSIAVLTLTLGATQNLSVPIGGLSLLCVAPALVGQITGQKIRDRMAEKTFRTVFLYGLLGLSFYLLARSVLGF